MGATAGLARKLLIKPGNTVLIVNAPNGYAPDLPAGATFVKRGPADVVQVFVASQSELSSQAAAAIKAVTPGGMLWVCYPKMSSGRNADLTRDRGWESIHSAGFQGVAMVSIDATWSAMRLRPITTIGGRK